MADRDGQVIKRLPDSTSVDPAPECEDISYDTSRRSTGPAAGTGKNNVFSDAT